MYIHVQDLVRLHIVQWGFNKYHVTRQNGPYVSAELLVTGNGVGVIEHEQPHMREKRDINDIDYKVTLCRLIRQQATKNNVWVVEIVPPSRPPGDRQSKVRQSHTSRERVILYILTSMQSVT